ISERHDAHQTLLAVHHRQPADLGVGHFTEDLVHVLVFRRAAHVGAHYVGQFGGLGVAFLRHAAHHDVAVGHHAHQLVAVANGDHADVKFVHGLGSLDDRIRGRHGPHAAGHHVSNSCHFTLLGNAGGGRHVSNLALAQSGAIG